MTDDSRETHVTDVARPEHYDEAADAPDDVIVADADEQPTDEIAADEVLTDEQPTDEAAGDEVLSAAAEAEALDAVTPEADEGEPGAVTTADPSATGAAPSDPHGEIAGSEDPEAAARAALGLGERTPDEEEIAPEAAEAILRREQVEEITVTEEDVLEGPDVGLEDADLLEIYDEPSEPSPYDRPGDWYVVHTYSGYEKKVKSNLESRIKSLNMEDRIYEIVIPMDDVIEFKGGKKTVVQKKVFPGYLLCRMRLDDDSWQAVRNTPGVTGFVGSGAKPTPLSRKEVESILRVRPEDEPKKARPRLEYEVGDQVRVTAGPFADFNGMIDEINVDQSTLKVLVNIFGRETPVTLDFADVAKL